MLPFVKETEVAPVTAVKTGDAPQPLVVAGVELLMVTFAGRLSVSVKFVKAVSAGAIMLIRNLELAPGTIDVGLKPLVPVIPAPAT
jgi:hypothetical protein